MGNQIRRGTVLGVLRPDEKLTEVALATTLQVNRATVREALAQFAQEGLLTAEPYEQLIAMGHLPGHPQDRSWAAPYRSRPRTLKPRAASVWTAADHPIDPASTTITVVVEGPAHHRAALRLVRWRPSGSKLSDASHARNASRTRGQSASTIAYQAVSRLRPLITTACRKIPS